MEKVEWCEMQAVNPKFANLTLRELKRTCDQAIKIWTQTTAEEPKRYWDSLVQEMADEIDRIEKEEKERAERNNIERRFAIKLACEQIEEIKALLPDCTDESYKHQCDELDYLQTVLKQYN